MNKNIPFDSKFELLCFCELLVVVMTASDPSEASVSIIRQKMAIGLGTWYSGQSGLVQAATAPHARNRSDSIYCFKTRRIL
jgi:hypothetical protein